MEFRMGNGRFEKGWDFCEDGEIGRKGEEKDEEKDRGTRK
jgi:hypothetical protein